MKTTITAFKKMTTVKIKQALPLEVTSSGKTIFFATHEGGDSDPAPIETGFVTQWLSGGSKEHAAQLVRETYERANGATPVFVTYNIPHRDNGNYSAGGAQSAEEYYAWIGTVGAEIGDRRAIIVHEPDAVGLSWNGNFSGEQRYKQWEYLSIAIDILKKQKNVKIFMDASMWIDLDRQEQSFKEIINRRATDQIDGFSVNVSGYAALDEVEKYGNELAKRLGKEYVIDTSRNGNGNPHPGKWCNLTGTKVGKSPIMYPHGQPPVYAYLWIKIQGESDGPGINDDGSNPRKDVPEAGEFWPEYHEALFSGDWTKFKKKYNV